MSTATLYLDLLRAVIFDVDGSILALAEEKTSRLHDQIDRDGVAAYLSTVAFVTDLQRRHVATAVVSSSRHCADMLRASRVDHLFDVRVDGTDLERLGLPGGPDPAAFAEATRKLGTRPAQCAIVADSINGVEAGYRGGFVVVLGIDRRGDLKGAMYDHGATVVVSSLDDVHLVETRRLRLVSSV